jgi:hypothetical protein
MPRKPTPVPQVKEATLVPGTLEADTAAANQLAVARLEQNERVAALAKQLNYQGSTDPAVLENSAKDAIRRIGMATFELGGYLLLLKEACAHGAFLPTLDRLKLEQRAAQQYMQVTRRFSNTQTSADLNALGVSKLTEMLILDNEQLDELLELGQTGELALDDVATMSVRQLRAAVREERQERLADKAVSDKKQARIEKLERDLLRIKKLTPDEDLARLKKEATSIANDAEGAILGNLRQALIALANHGDERDQHAVFMAGLVGQVQAQLTALREEFKLPDASTLAQRELAAEVSEWAFPAGKKD